MKKKMMSLGLALVMCLTLCVPAFATTFTDNIHYEDVQLSGFSYHMDGSQVDTSYSYSILCDIDIHDGNAQISIDSLNTNEEIPLKTFQLERLTDDMYVASISATSKIILDMTAGQLLVDVMSGDIAYAFGGNRLSEATEKLRTITIENSKPSVCAMPALATAAQNNVIEEVRTSRLYFAAIWNPNNDNRLAFRVNTRGDLSGVNWLLDINISGNVPSNYIIESANPSGTPIHTGDEAGALNFLNALTYIPYVGQYINILLPCFVKSGSTTMSSTYINQFEFRLNMKAAWNDMLYSSGSTANGVLTYLFLNSSGGTPNPSGTVSALMREPGFMTYTYTLDF